MLVTGFLGGDGDGATDRIAPVQCALGTPQHFNLLNVIQLLVELGGVGQQYPINDDGRRQLTVSGRGDAANIKKRVTRALGLYQGDVGGQVHKILGGLYACCPDFRFGESANRDGALEQRFRSLSSGNNNLLKRCLSNGLTGRQGSGDPQGH